MRTAPSNVDNVLSFRNRRREQAVNWPSDPFEYWMAQKEQTHRLVVTDKIPAYWWDRSAKYGDEYGAITEYEFRVYDYVWMVFIKALNQDDPSRLIRGFDVYLPLAEIARKIGDHKSGNRMRVSRAVRNLSDYERVDHKTGERKRGAGLITYRCFTEREEIKEGNKTSIKYHNYLNLGLPHGSQRPPIYKSLPKPPPPRIKPAQVEVFLRGWLQENPIFPVPATELWLRSLEHLRVRRQDATKRGISQRQFGLIAGRYVEPSRNRKGQTIYLPKWEGNDEPS